MRKKKEFLHNFTHNMYVVVFIITQYNMLQYNTEKLLQRPRSMCFLFSKHAPYTT